MALWEIDGNWISTLAWLFSSEPNTRTLVAPYLPLLGSPWPTEIVSGKMACFCDGPGVPPMAPHDMSRLEDAKEGKKEIKDDPTGMSQGSLALSHPSHQKLHQKENKIASGDTLGNFGGVKQYGKKFVAYLKS